MWCTISRAEFEQIKAQLGRIEDLLINFYAGVKKAMAALDDEITQLTAQVANDTTVEASAVTLINGFAAQLAAAVAAAAAAGATPAQLAALQALGTTITANNTSLAAAVAANTAAAPAAAAAKP